MIRRLPPAWLNLLMRALMVVILFTPVASNAATHWLVPAWLYAGYSIILGQSDQLARALSGLGLAAIIMGVVWLLELVRRRVSRGGDAHGKPGAAREAS